MNTSKSFPEDDADVGVRRAGITFTTPQSTQGAGPAVFPPLNDTASSLHLRQQSTICPGPPQLGSHRSIGGSGSGNTSSGSALSGTSWMPSPVTSATGYSPFSSQNPSPYTLPTGEAPGRLDKAAISKSSDAFSMEGIHQSLHAVLDGSDRQEISRTEHTPFEGNVLDSGVSQGPKEAVTSPFRVNNFDQHSNLPGNAYGHVQVQNYQRLPTSPMSLQYPQPQYAGGDVVPQAQLGSPLEDELRGGGGMFEDGIFPPVPVERYGPVGSPTSHFSPKRACSQGALSLQSPFEYDGGDLGLVGDPLITSSPRSRQPSIIGSPGGVHTGHQLHPVTSPPAAFPSLGENSASHPSAQKRPPISSSVSAASEAVNSTSWMPSSSQSGYSPFHSPSPSPHTLPTSVSQSQIQMHVQGPPTAFVNGQSKSSPMLFENGNNYYSNSRHNSSNGLVSATGASPMRVYDAQGSVQPQPRYPQSPMSLRQSMQQYSGNDVSQHVGLPYEEELQDYQPSNSFSRGGPGSPSSPHPPYMRPLSAQAHVYSYDRDSGGVADGLGHPPSQNSTPSRFGMQSPSTLGILPRRSPIPDEFMGNTRYPQSSPLYPHMQPPHQHHQHMPQPLQQSPGGHFFLADTKPYGNGYLYQAQFKRAHRCFLLGSSAPGNVKPGDFVIVEADRGEDMGVVVSMAPIHSPAAAAMIAASNGSAGKAASSNTPEILKQIIRVASLQERAELPMKWQDELGVLELCRERARDIYMLPMSVVDAEYQFDRHKLTIYYSASRRVDFRELVRDLFAMYKTRIWMEHVTTTHSSFRPSESAAKALATGMMATAASASIPVSLPPPPSPPVHGGMGYHPTSHSPAMGMPHGPGSIDANGDFNGRVSSPVQFGVGGSGNVGGGGVPGQEMFMASPGLHDHRSSFHLRPDGAESFGYPGGGDMSSASPVRFSSHGSLDQSQGLAGYRPQSESPMRQLPSALHASAHQSSDPNLAFNGPNYGGMPMQR